MINENDVSAPSLPQKLKFGKKQNNSPQGHPRASACPLCFPPCCGAALGLQEPPSPSRGWGDGQPEQQSASRSRRRNDPRPGGLGASVAGGGWCVQRKAWDFYLTIWGRNTPSSQPLHPHPPAILHTPPTPGETEKGPTKPNPNLLCGPFLPETDTFPLPP